jgi:hypothetical protein
MSRKGIDFQLPPGGTKEYLRKIDGWFCVTKWLADLRSRPRIFRAYSEVAGIA